MVLNIPYVALVWGLGPVVGCSDRGYRPSYNYFDPEEVVEEWAGALELSYLFNTKYV
jgi:hypothetical protein